MKAWTPGAGDRPRKVAARVHRGRCADQAGRAAEDSVAARYLEFGYTLAHRRWRGRSGEVDLILRGPDGIVFVEVKRGRDFDRALDSLGPRQIDRICRATEEFVAGEPDGMLTDVRFDVGLVDGTGQVRILENALAA